MIKIKSRKATGLNVELVREDFRKRASELMALDPRKYYMIKAEAHTSLAVIDPKKQHYSVILYEVPENEVPRDVVEKRKADRELNRKFWQEMVKGERISSRGLN